MIYAVKAVTTPMVANVSQGKIAGWFDLFSCKFKKHRSIMFGAANVRLETSNWNQKLSTFSW